MFQKLANSERVGLQGLDDLTWNDPLDNTRKMSAKCLLILSVEMIFIFDEFADDQINKIS